MGDIKQALSVSRWCRCNAPGLSMTRNVLLDHSIVNRSLVYTASQSRAHREGMPNSRARWETETERNRVSVFALSALLKRRDFERREVTTVDHGLVLKISWQTARNPTPRDLRPSRPRLIEDAAIERRDLMQSFLTRHGESAGAK